MNVCPTTVALLTILLAGNDSVNFSKIRALQGWRVVWTDATDGKKEIARAYFETERAKMTVDIIRTSSDSGAERMVRQLGETNGAQFPIPSRTLQNMGLALYEFRSMPVGMKPGEGPVDLYLRGSRRTMVYQIRLSKKRKYLRSFSPSKDELIAMMEKVAVELVQVVERKWAYTQMASWKHGSDRTLVIYEEAQSGRLMVSVVHLDNSAWSKFLREIGFR